MAILVLGNTGYLIGTGTPAMPGEASDNFLFGYIRFAHFAAGYVLTVGFLLRIYWAFLSGPNARQIFYVPLWRRCFGASCGMRCAGMPCLKLSRRGMSATIR